MLGRHLFGAVLNLDCITVRLVSTNTNAYLGQVVQKHAALQMLHDKDPLVGCTVNLGALDNIPMCHLHQVVTLTLQNGEMLLFQSRFIQKDNLESCSLSCLLMHAKCNLHIA